jgi:hypothetical protein
MNILYYGFDGPAANPLVGWIFLFGTVLFAVLAICELCEKEIIGGIFFGIAAIILFYSTIYAFLDHRVPIVKATVDNSISYVEMNNHYELMKQEGKLYIFKVLDISNEGWEAVVEEQNK